MTEELEKETKCDVCGNNVSFHRRTCHVCEADIGFPNIRQAVLEDSQLNDRYISAIASANARNVIDLVNNFEGKATKSKAVIARNLPQMIGLIDSDNALLTTFGQQIGQGARLAEHNQWDKGRASTEALIHPLYHEDIHYAALSLTDKGLPYYGNCHIVLKSELIEKRASVFEENPFIFMAKHQVIAGTSIPKGYRAVWSKRGKLAVAKLYSKIDKSTKEKDFQSILISFDSDGTADCIEVHIFGSIHAKAFSKLTICGQMSGMDHALLNAYRSKIDTFGIVLEEDNS